MRARRSLLIAGFLTAIAIVVAVLFAGNESETVPAGATAQPVANPARPVPSLPRGIGDRAPAPAVAPEPPPPPPPSEPESAERPAPTPLAQDDLIKRRESGLQLLDDTIARVERERDEAAKAKDAERVSQARVRLQRLAAVRKQRADELEQARRGELPPNPDDLPAGPRPQ